MGNIWHSSLTCLDDVILHRRTGNMATWADTLAWSWSEGTLHTYRQYVRSLHERALRPGAPTDPFVLVKTFLQERVAAGIPASSVRGCLSALQCLYTLELLPWSVPRSWWRLSTCCTRLDPSPRRPRTWLPLTAILQMATNATSKPDFVCICTVLLALACGLRFAEACAITPGDLGPGPLPFFISIRPVKQRPGSATHARRTLTPYLASWTALLSNLTASLPRGVPICGATALRVGYARLQVGTDAAGMGFHSLRRGAARYLHSLGHPLAAVAAWCRWASLPTAIHYIGPPEDSDVPAFILPLPGRDFQTGGAFFSTARVGSLDDLFPTPAVHQQGGGTQAPSRSKRARLA